MHKEPKAQGGSHSSKRIGAAASHSSAGAAGDQEMEEVSHDINKCSMQQFLFLFSFLMRSVVGVLHVDVCAVSYEATMKRDAFVTREIGASIQDKQKRTLVHAKRELGEK